MPFSIFPILRLFQDILSVNPINIVDSLDKHIQKHQETTFAFDNIFALKKALNNVRDALEGLAENNKDYSIQSQENIYLFKIPLSDP